MLFDRILYLPISKSVGELYFNIITILEMLIASEYLKKFETILRSLLFIKDRIDFRKDNIDFNLLNKKYKIRNDYAHGKYININESYIELENCILLIMEITHKLLSYINFDNIEERISILDNSVFAYSQNLIQEMILN